ncbi:MAG: hypothetical protein AB1551_07995 [Actinomycetota bacterium]
MSHGPDYLDRWFVIGTTEYPEPGRRYILAECAERAFAMVVAEQTDVSEPVFGDLEAWSLGEVLADSELAEAFDRWQAQDDPIRRAECAAVAAITEAGLSMFGEEDE